MVPIFSLYGLTVALLKTWDANEDITGGIEMLAWLLYNSANDGVRVNLPTQVHVVDVLNYEVGCSVGELEVGNDLWTTAGTLADRLERAVFLAGYAIHVDNRGIVELPSSDERAAICTVCGRGWDDRVSSVMAPALSGRCPFEGEHEHAGDATEEEA